MALDGWATLDNLKHQCESLKPGTEYVIKITQQQLDEQFKKVITNDEINKVYFKIREMIENRLGYKLR